MSVTVRLTPSGHEFPVEKGETILESALRSGLAPGYGCANGSCGDCKARVVSGEVSDIRFHDFAIGEAEKRMGYTLLCSATALGDSVIEASEASSPEDIPVQNVKARVYKQERIGKDLMLLNLRVQRGRILRFLAGQHVELTLKGLPPRKESVASCHCDGLNLQFHLRRLRGDPFAERVFTGLKSSDKVDIEGPRGNFILRVASRRPIAFLAYDMAFGPVKSLIEHAISLEWSQPICLYRLSPGDDEPYLHHYCRSWADALDDFSYQTFKGIDPDDDTGTLAGSCESAVLDIARGLGDMSDFDVYAAGPDFVIEPVRTACLHQGLPEEQLFVDTP